MTEVWKQAKELLIGSREEDHYFVISCTSCGRQNLSLTREGAQTLVQAWHKCPTCGKQASIVVQEITA